MNGQRYWLVFELLAAGGDRYLGRVLQRTKLDAEIQAKARFGKKIAEGSTLGVSTQTGL